MKGVLDCLIHTPNGEYIPVDYKYQSSEHGRIHLHHKYQLVGYSLLVDENYGTNVRRGFIYYANENKTIPLEITFYLKKYLVRTIQKIKELIAKQQEPPVKSCPAACGNE